MCFKLCPSFRKNDSWLVMSGKVYVEKREKRKRGFSFAALCLALNGNERICGDRKVKKKKKRKISSL